jgi:hypothetical protein
LSHRFMVVVSGSSEYGKPFVHVFDVVAEDKESARRLAVGAMNEPLGVLREYRKIPVDHDAPVLIYRIEFLVPSN